MKIVMAGAPTRDHVYALRAALLVARPIIEGYLQMEIESYSEPEKEFRPGSIKSSCGLGSYYNPDTIDEVGARRDVQKYQRVLKKIDAALNNT